MRSCTCHPDDNPPAPCAGKYALSECRAAAASGLDAIRDGSARKKATRLAKPAKAPRCVGCKIVGDDVGECSVCGNFYFKSCNGGAWLPIDS